MLDLCLELLPLCFSPQPLPTPSLSDRGTRPHPSSDACQEASRVFWFCLQQLHLNGDILGADFYPNWQLQQHVWPKFVQQVCAVPLHSTDTPSSPSRFASAVLVCVALIPLVDSVSRQQFHAKRRVLAPNSPFCDHSCRQLQPCRCKRAIAGLVTRHWHLQPPGVPCDSSRRGCRVRLQPASVWPSSHFSGQEPRGSLCPPIAVFLRLRPGLDRRPRALRPAFRRAPRRASGAGGTRAQSFCPSPAFHVVACVGRSLQ